MQRKSDKYHVIAATKQGKEEELHGAELAEATAWNLLIGVALTRSCLQELSMLLPEQAQQCNLAIPVMEALMRLGLSATGLSPILSILDLQRTLNYTCTGSLKIFSDHDGIGLQHDDVEMSIVLSDMTPYTGDVTH